jgi:hypothetical protein
MEYIQGQTLKNVVRGNGPLQPRDAIDIMVQVGKALGHAHANNIVHRDVKPQNIMVTPEGHVKVTDFGLAGAIMSAVPAYTGEIVGSLYYLSPEQARGEPVTEQGDIYSLGIILYELMTGQLPYTGDTPADIILKHLRETPPLPGQLGKNSALDSVIAQAMAKSTDDRYRNVKELLDDLARIAQSLQASEAGTGTGTGAGTGAGSRTGAAAVVAIPAQQDDAPMAGKGIFPTRKDVLRLLAEARKADKKYVLTGSAMHKYRLNGRISAAKVRKIETKHNFKLPEDYFRFITEIGDGGAGPHDGLYRFGTSEERLKKIKINIGKPFSPHSPTPDGLLILGTQGGTANTIMAVSGEYKGKIFVTDNFCSFMLIAESFGQFYRNWLDGLILIS